MALKIIGCQTLQGTFNGHDYHNLKFHCLKEIDKNIVGQGVETFSIKYSNCTDLLQTIKNDLNALIGREVDVYYDQYRKPFKIDLR